MKTLPIRLGPGEDLRAALEAAVRELQEEAGLIATTPPRLISVHSNERYFRGDHVVIYGVDAFETGERDSHGEIAEIGWFALDALPAPLTAATVAAIEALAR